MQLPFPAGLTGAISPRSAEVFLLWLAIIQQRNKTLNTAMKMLSLILLITDTPYLRIMATATMDEDDNGVPDDFRKGMRDVDEQVIKIRRRPSR